MVGLAALAVARWESFYLIYEEKINYKYPMQHIHGNVENTIL